ncbi:4562_t:CDS:2 [Acaulospora morrowiae]|uniref:4562_t:CDS:1 n=1 Tax=Acaulospora morrowiae TaxID=94023 RepID=A0A9N9GSR1_9GLOM|nr:4562_t:CDS:2 [Acaulospora morrowiae]
MNSLGSVQLSAQARASIVEKSLSTPRPRLRQKEEKKDKNDDNPKDQIPGCCYNHDYNCISSPQRSSIIIDSKRTNGVSFTLKDEKIDDQISKKLTPKASDLMLESLHFYKSEDEFDSINLGESTCNGMTASM